MILALAKRERVQRPSKQKGRMAITDMERLSALHISLGLQLTLFRGEKSVSEMARELGVSPHVLRTMEYGVHDYTLTQLQRLSEQLGIDLDQLVKR